MITSQMTFMAEQASTRYGMLTDSWRSIFNNVLNSSAFGSAVTVERAIGEAYEIAEIFLDEERRIAERQVSEIATEARTATLREIASTDAQELTDRALEHLGETGRYILDELVAQIHRDIALLRQSIQRVVLEVSIAAVAQGVPERNALIEYRIANQTELQFVFHDRQARKWPSKKFVRAMWRHTLLAAYNEIVLLTLAEHGITRAQVRHEDAKSEVHGMIVAIGSDSQFPTYSEVRDGVFHPNANAILAREGAHVST